MLEKFGDGIPQRGGAQMVEDRRFREFFEISVVVTKSVWKRLSYISQIPFGGEPKHMLWALLFIKVYPKEIVMCRLINVKDPKTFRGCQRFYRSYC